jgi:hypothetical protein
MVALQLFLALMVLEVAGEALALITLVAMAETVCQVVLAQVFLVMAEVEQVEIQMVAKADIIATTLLVLVVMV